MLRQQPMSTIRHPPQINSKGPRGRMHLVHSSANIINNFSSSHSHGSEKIGLKVIFHISSPFSTEPWLWEKIVSRRTFFTVFSTQLALWCGDSAEVVSRTSPTHPETPWLEDEGSILLGWHMFIGAICCMLVSGSVWELSVWWKSFFLPFCCSFSIFLSILSWLFQK